MTRAQQRLLTLLRTTRNAYILEHPPWHDKRHQQQWPRAYVALQEQRGRFIVDLRRSLDTRMVEDLIEQGALVKRDLGYRNGCTTYVHPNSSLRTLRAIRS